MLNLRAPHISAKPDDERRRPTADASYLGEFDELIRTTSVMTTIELGNWSERRAAKLADVQARIAAANVIVLRRGPGRPPRLPRIARAA